MKTPTQSVVNEAVKTKRCAIYIHKPATVGLDQEFSSLDAQREACVAYVERQPGWTLIDAAYAGGGFADANAQRPAFQRLLADLGAGRIDMVFVYESEEVSDEIAPAPRPA
jgi:hypothetical protein